MVSPVLSENREMIDSFTLITDELNALASNLQTAEIERDRMKQEQIAELSTIKAETLAAKAAAAAAEEAQRAAEAAAKVLQEKVAKQSSSELMGKKLEPPRFIAPLVDAKIDEGGKYVFECLVTGNPIPKISWKKENIPVESNPDYFTQFDEERGLCSLSIEETFAEDSARYFCYAVNSLGSAETSGFLRVIGNLTENFNNKKFLQFFV